MKKLRISMFLIAGLIGLNFNSCKKDDFSEKDAMKLQAQLDKQKLLDQDTLNSKNYRVSYTLTLVDASTSTLKSASIVSAISGAKVKFVQDTTVITRTADASGIVAFTDLKPGLANINITLDSYSEVNFTVNLSSSQINGGRQLSNIIPLIPIAGTATGIIKGKIICETDLTNISAEVVPIGTKIIAMVRANSDALPSTGGNNIVSISYDNLSLSATTDATGNFSMTVPATILGLTYDITVSDFTFDQKLLQDKYFTRDTSGVLTIPTNFGSSFSTASSVSAGTPVIVTIGTPDYTFTAATATAVISNNLGLSYVQDTHLGSYYGVNQNFTINIKNPAVGGTDAQLSLGTSNDGHVVGAINSNGSNFPSTFDGSTFTLPYIKTAAKAYVSSIGANGAIISYSVNSNQGEFYSLKNLQFVKLTGIGVGPVNELPSAYNNGNSLTFNNSTITLTKQTGSGYAVGDSLILSVNSTMSDVYTAKLFLSTGSLSGINITFEGANYIAGQVDVIISSPVAGNTATASASVTNGKISSIVITKSGNGYSVAPIVTVVNKAEKTQALFTAIVSNAGQITGFNTVNAGNGYLTVPTVTITSAIPGAGSGSSAYATVSGGQVSLSLVNKGNGYRGNIPNSAKDFSGNPSTVVKGSGTSIINIDLGTGKRNIEQ